MGGRQNRKETTMERFDEIVKTDEIVDIGYLTVEPGKRFSLPHYRDGNPVSVTESVAREAFERFDGWCFVSQAPIGKIFRLYPEGGDPRHDTEVFDTEQLIRYGFHVELVERVHAAGLRFFWHPVVSNSILIGAIRPDGEFFGVLDHYCLYEDDPDDMYCVMSDGASVPVAGLFKNLQGYILHGIPDWAKDVPATIREIYDSLE